MPRLVQSFHRAIDMNDVVCHRHPHLTRLCSLLILAYQILTFALVVQGSLSIWSMLAVNLACGLVAMAMFTVLALYMEALWFSQGGK